MTSDKKSASLLADIFIKKGLSEVIISPGSRNAPIITAFANRREINSLSIVDERSAAFFALGIALQTKKAVAIACTSGTASLNYAPAIAEAYYQKVPLLIFTADRPKKLIDIGDGQTIRQNNVYANYIKASFELSENLDSKASFDLANIIVNRAIDLAHFPEPGPVHINLPFSEPLYNTTEERIEGALIEPVNKYQNLSDKFISKPAERWNKYDKIMLIAGQQHKSPELNEILSKMVESKNLVLLTETTSNLFDENFVGCIDNVLTTIDDADIKQFAPDLLITFGGHIVSKKVKKFLRENKPNEHWHISQSGEKMDTYLSLTKVVKSKPEQFFALIFDKINTSNPKFATLWMKKRNKAIERRDNFLANIAYSDLQIFDILLKHIPVGTNLHLGNSTPVRYAQLFGSRELITYYSNRGVSGIDGQVSTASGAAYASDKTNLLITGDLGFLYDSNGLMNQNLTPNLKIIVINNGGGGIFQFIPGPDTLPQLKKFFVAQHNLSAEKIAEAFGIKYFKASKIKDILYSLPEFFNENNKPAIMEIFTPEETNANLLRAYFEFLKE